MAAWLDWIWWSWIGSGFDEWECGNHIVPRPSFDETAELVDPDIGLTSSGMWRLGFFCRRTQ